MKKVLKKYKIIPEHLYVKRDADKQLRLIIEEMESPGYVLVARQMGKTNLLFNAERDLKSNNRLFVYVDLSNLFESEKDCYQNIIDNIIEQNEDVIEKIEPKIREIRKDELPPHKEYTRSLRVILKYFNGDIIIILDEIDALKSVEYSDHIFAQIRSTYFQRKPFPDYKRLTYVLSGVIDPTDLIKDKNKSPFNIGEKIYLNDFILEEHREFVRKSKLKISEGVSDEIFTWTNGNPRLTFDICAEVESNIIDGVDINKESIETIIKKKYLTNFDIAPIDHIRDRIKSNDAVIEAVINIQKGINNISDEIKQKLYLYGVINSSFDEKTVIKNKIILKSLSLEWLNSLTDKSQITVTYGLAQYENKEYRNAIATFIQILSHSELDNETIETCNYFIGRAYFYLRDFDNAQKYFSSIFSDNIKNREAMSLLGICKLKTDFEEAVILLEDVINVETNDFAYHNSLLNLAINLPDKENERSYTLLQKLYDSTYKAKDIKDNELNKLRTLALYYQFEIHNNNNEKKESLEKIMQAKLYANDSDSLYIIFLEYLLDKKEELRRELIIKMIDRNITFDVDNTYPISFNENHLLYYIDTVYDDSDLFTKVINYSIESLFNKEKNKYDLIYEVSRISASHQTKQLTYLLKNKNEIDNSLQINILRDISFINSDNYQKFFNYFDDYLKLFKDESVSLKSADILLFSRAIKHYSSLGKFETGLSICGIIEQKIDTITEDELKFESLIIYYWYASLHLSLKNKQEAISYADKTLDMINNIPLAGTSIIDEKGMKSISEQMNDVKNHFKVRVPIISDKKYKRNTKVKVKYINGTIKEGKYKIFESDIRAEKCKVIE